MCLTCTIEAVTGIDLQEEGGHDALEALGRIEWPPATEQMLECAAYISALYANKEGGTGGPLHIATDDSNLEDSHLEFCRKNLQEWGPYWDDQEAGDRVLLLSRWILDLLEPMSVPERHVSVSLAHGSLTEVHGRIYMPRTEFPIREEIRDDDGNWVATQWGFRSRAQGPFMGGPQ
jgi:hypothetical protein